MMEGFDPAIDALDGTVNVCVYIEESHLKWGPAIWQVE